MVSHMDRPNPYESPKNQAEDWEAEPLPAWRKIWRRTRRALLLLGSLTAMALCMNAAVRITVSDQLERYPWVALACYGLLAVIFALSIFGTYIAIHGTDEDVRDVTHI